MTQIGQMTTDLFIKKTNLRSSVLSVLSVFHDNTNRFSSGKYWALDSIGMLFDIVIIPVEEVFEPAGFHQAFFEDQDAQEGATDA